MNRPSSTTSPRTILSPRDLTRCSTCKEYLSVGPITQSSDSTYACGRCPALGNNVDCYEASTTLFLPCIFGCNMLAKYGNVLRHENRCTFKPITCPAVGCDLDITKTDLLRHFRERHSDSIMTTREIALSTLRSYENRLYVWENHPLIVQTRISGIFVYIRVTTIENEDINIRRIFYRVKLLDKTVPVSLYSRKTPESRDMLKLNSKLLDNHIYFDLYDRRYERLTSRYLDSNTLNNLRCSICQFYSLPTTYTCQNRHNFCNTCFNRLRACTICQTRLKKAFSLEHLGRFIELPCYFKGSGCKHTVHVWNLSEAKLVKRCL